MAHWVLSSYLNCIANYIGAYDALFVYHIINIEIETKYCMQIGQFSLHSPVILAPMAGITDAIFRSLCHREGAGLTVSEMVSADTSLYASEKTLSRLAPLEDESSIKSIQIVGAEPEKLAQAAMLNVKMGADIIDINMGCPAKKVCKKSAGSALLANPMLVKQILRSVVKSVDVPVTLKIRTGIDSDSRNAVQIAQLAQDEGVQAIAVHGRTRADKFLGEAEYETIKEVKSAVDIPVIANGDIRNAMDAKKVLDYTCADAIMVGRAAQGNPWIFNEISQYLSHGVLVKPPSLDTVYETLVKHIVGLYKLHGEYRGVRIARKHIAWYCRDKQGVASFRQKINTIETATEQLKSVDHFFERFSNA
jgi:tRNA-dihydrouridine synthase B